MINDVFRNPFRNPPTDDELWADARVNALGDELTPQRAHDLIKAIATRAGFQAGIWGRDDVEAWLGENSPDGVFELSDHGWEQIRNTRAWYYLIDHATDGITNAEVIRHAVTEAALGVFRHASTQGLSDAPRKDHP